MIWIVIFQDDVPGQGVSLYRIGKVWGIFFLRGYNKGSNCCYLNYSIFLSDIIISKQLTNMLQNLCKNSLRLGLFRLCAGGLYGFSRVSDAVDFQKMKFQGIKMDIMTNMLTELDNFTHEKDREKTLKRFIDNIDGCQWPLEALTNKKWLNLSKSFPDLFVKAQLKTVGILGQKLTEKIKRKQLTKDEAFSFMEYIDKVIAQCYKPLQALNQDMREICEIVMNKNLSYLRFIFCTSFCENQEKEEAFLLSAALKSQKQDHLKKFMESYRAQICKLQGILQRITARFIEEKSQQGKQQKKELMLQLVQNLAECSYFYNEVVREIYKENKQVQWFMKIGEEVKYTMENVLKLYKLTGQVLHLTPTYILLRESQAKLDADLKFLHFSTKGLTNQQLISLKDQLVSEYQLILKEMVESLSSVSRKEEKQSRLFEIGLAMLKINMKICKLKELRLMEVHGNLFFELEDILGAIQGEDVKKSVGEKLSNYINSEIDKLIEARLSS